MEALWLSFAEDPTRGPVRAALGDVAPNPTKESYFTWPQFQQGSADMVLFAQDRKLMQMVSSQSIDISCSIS
jgi:hypothetical protein